MAFRFIIYGLIGWCLEIFWTGLASLLKGDFVLSGQTYLWMFPIYGLAIFLEPVYESIKDQPIILRGGVYTLIIFSIEYLTGWLLQSLIGVCPWDYTGTLFSIHGLIRLDYAPVWFVLGLFFEKVYITLKENQNKIF